MSEPTIISPPKIAPSDTTGPAYFVMPEDYRHGATGKKMAEPAAAKAAQSAPVVPPPAAIKPPVAALKKPGKKKPWVLLVVSLVVVLVGAGGAVWWFLAKTPTVQPQEKPTRPAVTTTTTKPTTPTEPTKTETKPETKPTEPTSPFPTAAVPGTDTDSDGLTDIEEKLVYNTNAKLPDSDSDGFLDGNEVFHRYNPAGTAPGTLFESGLVKLYQGSTTAADATVSLVYQLYYPSVWVASVVADTPRTTNFVATTGESITVSISTLADTVTTLKDWYEDQNKTEAVTAGTTKNGLETLTSEKQLTSYIRLDSDTILTVVYTTGIKPTIDYLQTLQMMINSIQAL